ncbi:MAG: glycosyltransferase [candidate division Zixibacteria bacterium]|nr:glycosyltransferase [candidate division Zixibacteria bacterium]
MTLRGYLVYMRILWLKSDFVLPPDTGGKIRSYNIIKQLAQIDEVIYLSFVDQYHTSEHKRDMETCVQKVISVFKKSEKKYNFGFYLRLFTRLFSPLPYIIYKYRSSEIKKIIDDLWKKQQFDILLCDFLEMSINLKERTPFPKILFQHNVESTIWERFHHTEKNWLKKLYFSYEKKRMRNYEALACQKFDKVLAVSEADKVKMEQEFGVDNIVVLPTGVDTEYFAPREVEKKPYNLVFTGSMDWLPNQDAMHYFCEEIYPLIKKDIPQINLCIVGRNPSEAILKLSENDKTVEVTGTVEDVRPYMAKSEIYIVPLRIGGGTRIKIFEAMSMGLPVIATSIGAEGLDVTPDQNIIIKDSPGDFAKSIVELLEDKNKRRRIAEEGRKLVNCEHDWKKVAEKLSQVCREVIISYENERSVR